MEERMMILKMIEDGKITAEEGTRLLEAIGQDQTADSQKGEPGKVTPVKERSKIFSDNSDETPLSKIGNFFEAAIQKVRDGDLDFNFGHVVAFDHTFLHDEITPASLSVALENGSVQVETSDDPGIRLDCEVKAYRVKDEEEARELFLRESIFSVSEEAFTFKTKSKSFKVRAVLHVPKNKYQDVSFYTFNGTLQAASLHANTFQAKTTNGAIKLSQLTAEKASMETMNGSVTSEASEVKLLEAKTLNGSVKVTGLIEDADIETGNGTIDYTVAKAAELGYVDLKTATGSVKLRVAPEVRFEAKLKSNVGSIHNRLANSEVMEERKELAQRFMHIVSNASEEKRVRVRATANTGSITVEDE
ncbi:DUF4097 domain-containing protein [Bacillus sp. FSL W7-1360]